jgi:hypothetical protein
MYHHYLVSQSQSYLTTGGLLPISSSWRQAPLRPMTRDFYFKLTIATARTAHKIPSLCCVWNRCYADELFTVPWLNSVSIFWLNHSGFLANIPQYCVDQREKLAVCSYGKGYDTVKSGFSGIKCDHFNGILRREKKYWRVFIERESEWLLLHHQKLRNSMPRLRLRL